MTRGLRKYSALCAVVFLVAIGLERAGTFYARASVSTLASR
jgi:hypothetical protein